MIREGRWKLVSHTERGGAQSATWELYDLDTDPLETRDLAAGQPDIVARLAKDWDRWLYRASKR